VHSLEDIIRDVVESFSVPHDYYLVKINVGGREDMLADRLTWDQGVKLVEEIMPTTKRGERLSLRERLPFVLDD
jgi:hypothetical protein